VLQREADAGRLQLGWERREVCYPTALLPEELLEACLTAGDLRIRNENDIRALEMTLTKIGVC
jgi:hypothetical protein